MSGNSKSGALSPIFGTDVIDVLDICTNEWKIENINAFNKNKKQQPQEILFQLLLYDYPNQLRWQLLFQENSSDPYISKSQVFGKPFSFLIRKAKHSVF
ncbi:MAG TPA: hypothetical protein VIW25_12360 [Nitrososphaeraceae archaeon]